MRFGPTALLVAVVLVLGACTSTPVPSGWTTVDLPGGVRPTSVSSAGGDVLVGGASGTGDAQRPRLARLSGGSWHEVPLAARSLYGAKATLVHVAQSGSRIVAIGTAVGGAHLNPRWSVWVGTSDGLTEQPQGTETFGGEDAGSLTGIVAVPPTIVGTWSVTSGQIGTATWGSSGAAWVRQTDPPTVVGGPSEQTTPSAVATLDGELVLSGVVTSLDATTRQRAVVWTADPGGSWSRTDLDTSAGNSAATDLACSSACWVAGRVGGRVALWTVATSGPKSARLPAVTVDPYLADPLVATAGAVVVVVVPATGPATAPRTSQILVRTGAAAWTRLTVLRADSQQVALSRGRLYVLGGRTAAAAPTLHEISVP